MDGVPGHAGHGPVYLRAGASPVTPFMHHWTAECRSARLLLPRHWPPLPADHTKMDMSSTLADELLASALLCSRCCCCSSAGQRQGVQSATQPILFIIRLGARD